jgi:hypothetical protein
MTDELPESIIKSAILHNATSHKETVGFSRTAACHLARSKLDVIKYFLGTESLLTDCGHLDSQI